MEDSNINAALKNYCRGIGCSNYAETVFKNSPKKPLNFNEYTQSTEDNTCGCIPTHASGITIDNDNTHMVHNMPIWYIYEIFGLKGKKIKTVHIECNKTVIGIMNKTYTFSGVMINIYLQPIICQFMIWYDTNIYVTYTREFLFLWIREKNLTNKVM